MPRVALKHKFPALRGHARPTGHARPLASEEQETVSPGRLRFLVRNPGEAGESQYGKVMILHVAFTMKTVALPLTFAPLWREGNGSPSLRLIHPFLQKLAST